jgi:carboxyl-terminal processing protease
MKNESTNSSPIWGSFASLRWAFVATLTIGLAGVLGWAMSWLVYYLLGNVEGLKPYMPAVAEGVFTIGTTGVPLLLGYLYFTGRARVLTSLSLKLHPFFHLDSHLPGFPANLGLNYRKVGATFKKIALWAVGGVAAAYLFDYLMGFLIAVGPSHGGVTGSELADSAAQSALPQSAEQALAMMSGVNFIVSAVVMALVAAFLEEFVFRGIVLNLWRTAFATQAAALAEHPSKYVGYVAKALAFVGAFLAVVIAAVLFALPHFSGLWSQIFFGVVAGVVYMQTRTIWAPILMHVLSNAVLPVVIVIGALTAQYHSNGSGATATTLDPSKVEAGSMAGATLPGALPSAGHVHDNRGLRVPGHREVILPEDGKVVRPLVVSVIQADFESADFNPTGNMFLQVCKPEECASQLPFLMSLAKQFPDVQFAQADSSKIAPFIARMETEQKSAAKSGKGTGVLTYPLYIYANHSLQIAPVDADSEAKLKEFIELNYQVYGISGGDDDETLTSYVSKACNVENPDAFNGKVLYACAYDLVVNTDLSLLDSAKRTSFMAKWQHKFDGGDQLSTEEGTAKAIRAMLSELGEMHTQFYTGKEFSSLAQSFDASLTGIGAPLTRLNVAGKLLALGKDATVEARKALAKITDDTPVVVFPAPRDGSPAFKAGLQKGDRIVEVDGKPSGGHTINEVVDYIRGTAGSSVTLKILRPVSGGSFNRLTLTIERAKVQTPEVTWEKADNGAAVVHIGMFGNHVSKEFTEALYTACTGKTLPAGGGELAAVVNAYSPEKDCGLKGLVIDLRGNPGGRLDQVVEMMQALMKEGTIVTTLSREGEQIVKVEESVHEDAFRRERIVDGKSMKVANHPRFWQVVPDGIAIVLVVNEGSASASELMSSGLQKNGRATVVGAPTFGKEVGQGVNPLDFGAGLKVTNFRFLPGGEDLGVAVLPDYETSPSVAYLDNPLDNPDTELVKALEVLAKGKEALVESKSASVVAAKEALAARTAEAHKARDEAIYAQQKAAAAKE